MLQAHGCQNLANFDNCVPTAAVGYRDFTCTVCY